MLDLLFSRTTGAGLSILRNGHQLDRQLDPAHQPRRPQRHTALRMERRRRRPGLAVQGGPGVRGVTVLRQRVERAGVHEDERRREERRHALRALRRHLREWRLAEAYANYLIQYTKFYAQEGIRITDLAFTNEPNFTSDYSSMRFTPAQAAEFAKVWARSPTRRAST